MPAKISAAIRQRATRIKLFLCDVDGVLTDGLIRCGLKARHRTAQGNALGSIHPRRLHPERGQQNPRHAVVSPFQGWRFFGAYTQGVALGCHVIALSARKTHGLRPTANIEDPSRSLFHF